MLLYLDIKKGKKVSSTQVQVQKTTISSAAAQVTTIVIFFQLQLYH